MMGGGPDRSEVDGVQIQLMRRALLTWFGRHRRDLPWRRTADPYAIWLSEVMLQQTTVRTVEPRWRRFLERFPTIEDLAGAEEEEVLAEWTGLGYYARARHLHAAARILARDFGGRLPESFEVLLALPGMGRYTAAAVASIAFGQPAAVVDANVERVLARLDAIEEPLERAAVKNRLWERAQELMDPSRAGDWNQAMMELGATVCLPRAPLCATCPVAFACEAFRLEEPTAYPVPKAKAPLAEVREAAVVIRRGDRVLILKRGARGSFANMWEIPRGEVLVDEASTDAAVRIVHDLTGLRVRLGANILRLRHVVMRRKIDLRVWEAALVQGRVRRRGHTAHEWVRPSDWAERPVSTTQRDIALYLARGRVPGKQGRRPEKSGAPDLFGCAGAE